MGVHKSQGTSHPSLAGSILVWTDLLHEASLKERLVGLVTLDSLNPQRAFIFSLLPIFLFRFSVNGFGPVVC